MVLICLSVLFSCSSNEELPDEKLIENVKGQIEKIYKHIKKNENAPKTDYLFNTKDDSKTNLKKTIEKIDTMNNITFIPRS